MRPARLLRYAGIAALVAAGAGLLAFGGVFNVAASAGHLPVVGHLMHVVMRNSVALRARNLTPAPAADENAAQLGALHYRDGCEYCHGAPGRRPGPVKQNMEPPPPHIVDAVRDWERHQLFWIVRHGIKMTGMPAWVAPGRDDEIVPVVEFLEAVPEMSAADYQRLIRGKLAEPRHSGLSNPDDAWLEQELQNCARCHGRDGAGIDTGTLPRIGGQEGRYLANSLYAYASGIRASGIMQPQVAHYNAEELSRLARHYADQPGLSRTTRSGAETGRPVTRGEEIALTGIPAKGVPPCSVCHGPAAHEVLPMYPVLNGQRRAYLELQLELFRDGQRGGSPYAHIMASIAGHLSPEDISAVADYYAEARTDETHN